VYRWAGVASVPLGGVTSLNVYGQWMDNCYLWSESLFKFINPVITDHDLCRFHVFEMM